MSENIKKMYVKKTLTYYLTEYLLFLISAIGIVVITSGSHQIGIPLYKINPMHWVLYFIIIYKRPENSSILVLAFLLPAISTIFTGHPIIIKSIVMGIELSVYGIIFSLLFTYYEKSFIIAFVVSQLIGHIVYYSLKYVLITNGVMHGLLFASSIYTQAIVFVVLGIALHLYVYKLNNK